MRDSLGDRMKAYEAGEAQRKFMPFLPIMARIDGRAFHSFTKGMKRPYDEVFSTAMIDTTKYLVKETGACMGYTQSDEISLVWLQTSPQNEVFFGGRISKMTSQLAAMATLYFYTRVLETMPEYAHRMPTFDARVWQVPSKAEAANVFLWREWDATMNSISMAAQSMYSAKQLHGKNGAAKQDMMMEKGVNWNAYPTFFKRGVYVQRRVVSRPFSVDEINKLPPKHAARTNPSLTVDRTECNVVYLPPLGKISNKEEVIFDGHDYKTYAE